MARLRPFRGLRYTHAAGEANLLVAPPTAHLTPAEREAYAVRNHHNAVAVAAPEGHGDDRSKFVRFARSAARLAEWRRAGTIAPEDRPALYHLTQRFGPEAHPRVSLLAVVSPDDDVVLGQTPDSKLREDRLRLLEATRTTFEPALAYFEDPDGALNETIRRAPAASESVSSLDQVLATLETIEDTDAIQAIERAFAGRRIVVLDGVEGVDAAREFAGGALVALTSLSDPQAVRLPIHRVVRRLTGGREAALARLAERFDIEEHHNRNLAVYLDRETAFGLATEGGRGFLLRPKQPIEGSPAAWLHREILGPLLGVTDTDPTLLFTDPVQAVRTADEGAAAAFLLPRPPRGEITELLHGGHPIPAGASRAYPAVPTGLVFWSMGDDA